jgi:hypothetical protein
MNTSLPWFEIAFITAASGAWLLGLRGGDFHNMLVSQVAELYRSRGFETRLEHPLRLPDGRIDYVDLLVRTHDCLLLVEVETTPRYVVVNVEKARVAELPLVIVAPNRKVRRQVAAQLQRLPVIPNASIYLLLISQLRQVMADSFPVFPAANALGKTIPREHSPPEKIGITPTAPTSPTNIGQPR